MSDGSGVDVSLVKVKRLADAWKAATDREKLTGDIPVISAAAMVQWYWVNAPVSCRHLIEQFVTRGTETLVKMVMEDDAVKGTNLLADFPLNTHDACLNFFGTCLRAWQMPITGRVLEIGCAEADWIGCALKADPSLQITGIDWRIRGVDDRWTFVRGNAMDVRHFEPASFDWIVSVSAIEHVGLGHYERDPVDEWGDVQVMENILKWLKPGGSVYFDVPYTPEGYKVHGTSHRSYDAADLKSRLFRHGFVNIQQAYSDQRKTMELLPAAPTTNPVDEHGYYYVGNWWMKG